ncbi:hypothetical protein RHOSPDRAFT_30695 [Rhodotorula sp. JG-1b]|nr:hypothetical protein RHOSPDRAFT_30695 [Rhodotorula sp. JG-1b]
MPRQTRPAAASTSFEPPNAHDRLQRMHSLRQFYENSRGNRLPAKPRSRGELDVLQERHQFVRDSRVDPSTLPWEDQLASKFYDSLFKEYAVVNLKHYKSGAVALRWRTEEEVLSGIGHLTCGSLRCRYHEPSPSIVAAQQQADDTSSSIFTTSEANIASLADPDSETPLVEARLEELEMPFGYLEQGVKKSALVKVVLCRECAKKLRYGRQKAKDIREEKERDSSGSGMDSTSALPPPLSSPSSSKRQRHRHASRSCPPPPSRPPAPRRSSTAKEDQDDDDDFRPELPPDLDHHHRQQRRRNDPSSGGGDRDRDRSSRERRRRSASPLSRRQ